MNPEKKISRQEALKHLWEMGVLEWKLDDNQKEIFEKFKNNKGKMFVINSSRQIGKSYTLCILGLSQCLSKPNSVVKYVAPTVKMARQITKTIIRELIEDCPKIFRPKYHTQENTWKFQNGSEMQFAGAEAENIESVRGGRADLCLIDEAGFIDDLKYAINSVLLPTTTTTGGKIVIASTPPKSASHDYIYYLEKAIFDGNYIKKTIFDNPRLKKEDIDLLAEESGGYESIDFRREYLAEIITDTNRAVIPEFNQELEDKIVRTMERPPYFDSYVAMDLGFRDFTVVLFGYYDFISAKLVIEDEVITGNKLHPHFTTESLAFSIKQKELHLWMHKKPYLRISDNNLIVINDLQQLHELSFLPTNKDDKEAALNHMRMLLANEKIIINPRCKTLIFHLRNAIWNKNRKKYEHGIDGSHFDAVDALSYMVRNVQFSKNPFPSNYNSLGGDHYFYNSYNEDKDDPMKKMLKNLYKINKSK